MQTEISKKKLLSARVATKRIKKIEKIINLNQATFEKKAIKQLDLYDYQIESPYLMVVLLKLSFKLGPVTYPYIADIEYYFEKVVNSGDQLTPQVAVLYLEYITELLKISSDFLTVFFAKSYLLCLSIAKDYKPFTIDTQVFIQALVVNYYALEACYRYCHFESREPNLVEYYNQSIYADVFQEYDRQIEDSYNAQLYYYIQQAELNELDNSMDKLLMMEYLASQINIDISGISFYLRAKIDFLEQNYSLALERMRPTYQEWQQQDIELDIESDYWKIKSIDLYLQINCETLQPIDDTVNLLAMRWQWYKFQQKLYTEDDMQVLANKKEVFYLDGARRHIAQLRKNYGDLTEQIAAAKQFVAESEKEVRHSYLNWLRLQLHFLTVYQVDIMQEDAEYQLPAKASDGILYSAKKFKKSFLAETESDFDFLTRRSEVELAWKQKQLRSLFSYAVSMNRFKRFKAFLITMILALVMYLGLLIGNYFTNSLGIKQYYNLNILLALLVFILGIAFATRQIIRKMSIGSIYLFLPLVSLAQVFLVIDWDKRILSTNNYMIAFAVGLWLLLSIVSAYLDAPQRLTKKDYKYFFY